MKKPLMNVPPAQAEALYDAALHETRRVVASLAGYSGQPPPVWDLRDWDEDDVSPLPEGRQNRSEHTPVNVHH